MNTSKAISILFIQGGGKGWYQVDRPIVASLEEILGEPFRLYDPELYWDESYQDYGWIWQIGVELSKIQNPVVLLGHWFGASMILKYLTENPFAKIIWGIFLLATPYWSGDDDCIQGIKLRDGFENNLCTEVPIFFYHFQDDQEVPITHLDHYMEHLPFATYRTIKSGGHQFVDDMSLVAKDITALLG